MISRKHWSPGSDVSVQSVERRDSGGWTVSGSLTPNGICPDCGLHSRRRHGWRRRRLQDYPAHGDGVTVTLWVCRWRCLAPACPRRARWRLRRRVIKPIQRRRGDRARIWRARVARDVVGVDMGGPFIQFGDCEAVFHQIGWGMAGRVTCVK